ncbi:MAG: NAD(P)-binding domain-containing protein [Lachnospiraceae bacterium]|nr:NAD(P)-binding domain-containing protein [Lachnospiraceae bacterium]
MRYCVIGAGGTGGCIAAYMARAGKDVTVIARGEHLAQIQKQGIRLETVKGTEVVSPITAYEMDEYANRLAKRSSEVSTEKPAEKITEISTEKSAEESAGRPDVIFVCVKGYSLEDVVPFIKKVSKKETIVIPILNLYGTGAKLQKMLPELLVTDGCIYIAAQIREPGTIRMNGTIFRIVYGVRDPDELRRELFIVAEDLRQSGIEAVLSENIRRDALQKFSYVSPMAAAGLYFHANAERFQVTGDERDTFAALVKEIDKLAEAMGISFQVDIVRNNLAILDALSPEASTSMQRDIAAGKPSEIDGLIFEVVRMADRYGVELPVYQKIAKELEPYGA